MDLEGFANQVSSSRGLLNEFSVGFEHHFNGLLQIRACLFERRSLCVRPGDFFNEANVAFWDFAEDGRELKFHGAMIRANGREAQHAVHQTAARIMSGRW